MQFAVTVHVFHILIWCGSVLVQEKIVFTCKAASQCEHVSASPDEAFPINHFIPSHLMRTAGRDLLYKTQLQDKFKKEKLYLKSIHVVSFAYTQTEILSSFSHLLLYCRHILRADGDYFYQGHV